MCVGVTMVYPPYNKSQRRFWWNNESKETHAGFLSSSPLSLSHSHMTVFLTGHFEIAVHLFFPLGKLKRMR